MIDFHDLTPSEQTFLTTAQTGEDGGYSEFCWVSMSGRNHLHST